MLESWSLEKNETRSLLLTLQQNSSKWKNKARHKVPNFEIGRSYRVY